MIEAKEILTGNIASKQTMSGNINVKEIIVLPDTAEDLTEELNTYNTELTEQETIINNIIEALNNRK